MAAEYGLRGVIDRVQPRCAKPVDGQTANGIGQARQQRGHAGDVSIVLARLVRAPEHRVFDRLGQDSGVAH